MQPEIKAWSQRQRGRAAYVRFYVKASTGSDVWCVMPRSPMLRQSIEAMHNAWAARNERRAINAQAQQITEGAMSC